MRLRKSDHWRTLYVSILIILGTGLLLTAALSRSVNVQTVHLDGSYQVASGLFRLADGQFPGRDFLPYLGVGLTYFLYPLFLVLGNNLAASIAAAHFGSILSFVVTIGLTAALLSSGRRGLHGLMAATFALVLVIWMPGGIPDWVAERLDPGNSIRPIRSLIAYLAVFAAYLVLKSAPLSSYRHSIVGAIAGAALLWSNDYGIITATMVLVLNCIHSCKERYPTWRAVVVAPAIALISAFLLLTVATAGHPLQILSYNFVDVAGDQYWYFSWWIAEGNILSTTDFFTKMLPELYGRGLGIVWIGLLVVTVLTRKLEYFALLIIGFSLAGGACIATVGGYRDGYALAFLFWCKTTLLFGGLRLGWEGLIFLLPKKRDFLTRRPEFAVLFAFVILLSVSSLLWKSYLQYKNALVVAAHDENRFEVKELGGFLPVSFRNYIETARSLRDLSVTEEYWGLWSATVRRHGAMPVDMILHALGGVRHYSRERLLNDPPSLIITSRRALSEETLLLNLSASWWFFEFVFSRYIPIHMSPTTILWRRIEQPRGFASYECLPISGEFPGVSIQTEVSGFYEVNIELAPIRSPRSTTLFIQNNLNNIWDSFGYVALSPHERTHSLLAYLDVNRGTALHLAAVGPKLTHELPEVDRCRARKIEPDFEGITDFEPSLNPEYSLDANESILDINSLLLRHGLSEPAWLPKQFFVVFNNAANLRKFDPGKEVVIDGAHTRRISHLSTFGYYLLVFIDPPEVPVNEVGPRSSRRTLGFPVAEGFRPPVAP